MTYKGHKNIFFTSDLHFWHKPILRPDFDNRPWPDLQAMEDGLIANWNSVVKPTDITIIVGDVFFCGTQRAAAIMKRLNGKKILVTGNHDGTMQASYNSGFDFVCEKLIMKIDGKEVLVSHYPYKFPAWKSWFHKNVLRRKTPRYMDRRPVDRGNWIIHGHTHSTERVNKKMINVGCMAWPNYAPVHIDVIESIIKTGMLPNGKAPND